MLRSYRLAWRGIPVLARFAAIPFALLLIVEGGLRHAAHIAQTWVDVTILENLMLVLDAAIVVPLTVAAYRLFLFGRETVKADAVDEFPTGAPAVLALSVITAVAFLPFFDMLSLMQNEQEMMPAIALAYHAFAVAGWVFGILIIVRSPFLLIQAIKGRDLNISLAWRQTAGNGWRMLGLMLAVVLPAAALARLADALALEPLGGEVDFGLWYVWLGLLGQVVGEAAIKVLVTAASVLAYAHITGFPIVSERGNVPVQPSLPFHAPIP